MKKILIIGCGHMGGALLKSWLNSNKYLITVVDPFKYKLLKKKYINKHVTIYKNINFLKKDSNVKFNFIIFATKPLDLNKATSEISSYNIDKKTKIVSVVAGKKIKSLEKSFKNLNNIFRVMPNMPASIGQSMNCIVSKSIVDSKDINQVVKLFSYSGKTIILKNENEIDMTTAVSGSGPGFVFNIIDAMENAAIDLGFNKEVAKILVTETFKGSINLLLNNKYSAKELVNTVATKGGTTEAGLKVMYERKMHQIFKEVTRESYKKAKAQGK